VRKVFWKWKLTERPCEGVRLSVCGEDIEGQFGVLARDIEGRREAVLLRIEDERLWLHCGGVW
jgi:hypothetical protein